MTTTRLEAFSDGVFAIAATLLILEIKVPSAAKGQLQHDLVQEWPSFASFAVSFLVIGILWVNHHAVFRYITHADRTVLFLNLGLLMAVSFLPYPTALMATYVRADDSNAHVAAFVYSATMFSLSICWNVMWYYVLRNEALHDATLSHVDGRAIARQGWFGTALYGATLAVAWVSAPLTLAVFGGLAVFWMLAYRPETRAVITETGEHAHHEASARGRPPG
jgi:uncharacterized membrane protein